MIIERRDEQAPGVRPLIECKHERFCPHNGAADGDLYQRPVRRAAGGDTPSPERHLSAVRNSGGAARYPLRLASTGRQPGRRLCAVHLQRHETVPRPVRGIVWNDALWEQRVRGESTGGDPRLCTDRVGAR